MNLNKVILFQNDHFVICDKPALVLSVPAREKTDSRLCLGLELQSHFRNQIFPVHRLDYEVSGLIMYAFSGRAHRASQEWFLRKKIAKTYQAVSRHQDFSHWPKKVGTDTRPIVIDSTNLETQNWQWKTQILKGKKRSFESPQGEWAETLVKPIRLHQEYIEWRLLPITGKSHQLRFEMSRHGFPLLGDSLYGSSEAWGADGLALRAIHLDLNDCDYKTWGLPNHFTVEPTRF